MGNALGSTIKKHALDFTTRWNPNDFQRFAESYVRNYIGQDERSGWEALVMSWQKGNHTSIHGHPQFASYTILSGELLIEGFKLNENGECVKLNEYVARAGDSFFAIGKVGRFDNHIHRLTCVSDNAHSLHIYSADARMGNVFTCQP